MKRKEEEAKSGRRKGDKGNRRKNSFIKPLSCSLRISLFSFTEFFHTFVSGDTGILKKRILILEYREKAQLYVRARHRSL